MKLLFYILICCIPLITCTTNTKTIRSFSISDDFYFEAKTLGNRGYTWLYLCRKNSSECIDIYGERDSTSSSHFINIDSIKINSIKGDTVFYTIHEAPPGNCFCISDSLLLSKRRVMSKETIKNNCQ